MAGTCEQRNEFYVTHIMHILA